MKLRLARLRRHNRHSQTISPYILIYMAWRNLLSHKLRTLLTIFGVTIGIGAIFFLLSLGLGLHNLVTRQVVGDKSVKAIDVSSPNSKVLHLTPEVINKIQQLPHITEIGTAYSYASSLTFNGGTADAVSYGVDEHYQELSNLNLLAGKFLANTDDHSIILDVAAIKTMGITDPKKALGQVVNVAIPLSDATGKDTSLHADFKVTGVVDDNAGSELYITDKAFRLAAVPYYSQAKLIVDSSNNVGQVRAQIESLGFTTDSPIDTLNQINQIFRVFTILLVGFGGVGMVVSILGMFNTLTVSLLERTKEIALMILMGARSNDMRRLFTYEAMLLSVIGAVAGIIIAIVLGWLTEGIMNAFAHRRGVTESFQLFATPLWAILGSIVFMMGVGLLVVHFPAERAKRINPITALRRE